LARGIRVGKERVRRMLQKHGIKARGKRKFVVTTDSKHKRLIAANLLQRNFTAAAPNQVWAGDITYFAADEGRRYLAVVLDLFNRQMVGMAHATSHAKPTVDGCTANGVVPPCAR
jgi:putative transposase